jgi:hypothetical protein
MIAYAEHNTRKAGLNDIILYIGDITDERTISRLDSVGSEQRFDIITCLWTLHPMPESTQIKALLLWKQLLAPGGKLVIERCYPDVASLETIKASTLEPGPKYTLADATT